MTTLFTDPTIQAYFVAALFIALIVRLVYVEGRADHAEEARRQADRLSAVLAERLREVQAELAARPTTEEAIAGAVAFFNDCERTANG